VDRQTIGEYGKASLYEWLQIELVPLLQKQILHSATLLANEMVMNGEHGIIARHPLSQQQHANFSLLYQPLQVSIHRPQTNAGECPSHSLIDLIRARVRMIPLQRFIDRG
jgi:hypothetical protein